jgi:non-specific protein-tyrosine kinase
MELKQYWHLLRKWTWLLILGAVVAAGTSFLVSRNTTPVYQASTTLLVTPGSVQSLDSYSSLISSEWLARTYAQLLGSAPVLEETYRRLGLTPGGDPAGAGSGSGFSLSAEPVRDTQLISLSVEGTDPELITAAANTLIQVFIEWQQGIQTSRYADARTNLTAEMEQVQASIQQLETEIQALQAQGEDADQAQLNRLQDQVARYRTSYSALLNSYSDISLAEANSGDTITVVSPAVRPTAPIRPQVMTNTLLAAVVGVILAAGVAFLVEYLDDTVKTPEDLEAVDLNVVSAVQRVNLNGRTPDKRLLAVEDPRSLVSESYRTLRTNLQFSSLDKPLRSLVVTSATAEEGKTTKAANLAVVMAQAGKRVVLIDADLRRPAAHRFFALPNREGLTSALVREPMELSDYLQSTQVPNLRVLTSGPVPPNPQELLGSQRMEELLLDLRERADFVLVDTPPVLLVADASILAARTDGVVVVVNTGQTRRTAVEQAVEGLRQMGANVVGAVLNMVHVRGGGDYYYGYSSHYYDQESRGGRRGLLGRLQPSGQRLAASKKPSDATRPPHSGQRPAAPKKPSDATRYKG